MKSNGKKSRALFQSATPRWTPALERVKKLRGRANSLQTQGASFDKLRMRWILCGKKKISSS
jgi:hypothetical protein